MSLNYIISSVNSLHYDLSLVFSTPHFFQGDSGGPLMIRYRDKKVAIIGESKYSSLNYLWYPKILFNNYAIGIFVLNTLNPITFFRECTNMEGISPI